MIDQSLNITVTINASPGKVLEAITNVKEWWATNVIGNTKDLNDVFTVRFGKTFSTIKVTEAIPGQKLVWKVIDCDLPLFANPKDWLNTKLIWEISTSNNITQLNFTHKGLTPLASCYEDCIKGWTFYVTESLKNLVEKGTGLPGTGIFAHISNGNRRYEGLLYFKNDPLPTYPDNFFFIDVKETKGEEVTKIYTAGNYHQNFNPKELKGEYFMIVENKPLYNNIFPLKDILELV